jgi:hypothetical protein
MRETKNTAAKMPKAVSRIVATTLGLMVEVVERDI